LLFRLCFIFNGQSHYSAANPLLAQFHQYLMLKLSIGCWISDKLYKNLSKISKGPSIYYVSKKVGGWVLPYGYNCLCTGWVGLNKCLHKIFETKVVNKMWLLRPLMIRDNDFGGKINQKCKARPPWKIVRIHFLNKLNGIIDSIECSETFFVILQTKFHYVINCSEVGG